MRNCFALKCIFLFFLFINPIFAKDDLLINAIENGNDQHAYEILRQGYNPNIIDQHVTPLMMAVMKSNENIVNTLLAFGANPDFLDEARNSSLHLAATSNNINIARNLIKYDANVNQVNFFGLTPLIMAVLYNRAHMVQLLIDNDANFSIKSNEGYNAIQYAIILKYWEIMKIFADFYDKIPSSMINELYQTIYEQIESEKIAEIFHNLIKKKDQESLYDFDILIEKMNKSIENRNETELIDEKIFNVNKIKKEQNFDLNSYESGHIYLFIGDYNNFANAEKDIYELQRLFPESLMEKSCIQQKQHFFSLFLGPFTPSDLNDNDFNVIKNFKMFDKNDLSNLQLLSEINATDKTHSLENLNNNDDEIYYIKINNFKNCANAMEILFSLQKKFPFLEKFNEKTVMNLNHCELNIGYLNENQTLEKLISILPNNIRKNSQIESMTRNEIDNEDFIVNAADLQHALDEYFN